MERWKEKGTEKRKLKATKEIKGGSKIDSTKKVVKRRRRR